MPRHIWSKQLGSPAADLNKTRLHKITFSAKGPPRTAPIAKNPEVQRREDGQVKPVMADFT